ncbi:MAG: thioredoxin [Clostridia bacterium]|nr:thioredoxin [Clostridia bacterium]
MNVLHANEQNFSPLLQSEKPVLVDFYAPWCGPCKLVGPMIDKLAAEHEEYVFAKVNVDEEQGLAKAFNVFSIPTLVVLKGGKETARSVGALPAARILEMLEK